MKNLNFLRFASRITLLLAVVVSFGLSANAQVTVPDGFQYQAIARDASGVPMANTQMSVKFIVDADNAMPVEQVFTTVQTNDFGLFNLVVGGIDFEGLVNPTVEVLIDLDGLGYNSLGVVPFQSVPYAEVAGNVAYVEAGQLHVGNDVFNVGNFFTGTPGIVEPLEAVVVDAAKGIEGFGNVGIEGALNVDGSVITGQQSIVFINNQDQNNGDAISGALRVAGGVGIAKDVYVGGSLDVAGDISNNGNLSTTDITADDIVATTIEVFTADVNDDLTVGGDATIGGNAGITGNATVGGDLTVDGNLDVTDITASDVIAESVTADDFYGNFHGGTLDLGAAKSVTVGDIHTTVTDSDEVLVTAGAVFDADAALEEDLTELIEANEELIASNAQGIIHNTLAIQSNYALIVTNSDAIQQNRDDIASNLVLIGENADAIEENAEDIESIWTFIDEDLDLQHVYDNGNVINTAANTPVDVIATAGVSVQGSNNGFVGQLAGDNAAVYGAYGTDIWGALAYSDGLSKGFYAGYFNGNVNITNDLTVQNTVDIFSDATALDSETGALVVEGGVGIGDNLYVANAISAGNNVNVGNNLNVTHDSYLNENVTIGTTDAHDLIVNATSVFNATVTIEEMLTVNADTYVNGTLNASDAVIAGDLTVGGTTDVQEFTLAGDYGTASDLMISNGPDTNPSWVSVEELMEDLEDGLGIKDFTFDGSAPAVVEANIDDITAGAGTMEFAGDLIAVNEDYAFNWTADHHFAEDVTIEGVLGTSTIENVMADLIVINDDVAIYNNLSVASDVDVDGDATIDGDVILGTDCGNFLTVNAMADFNCMVTASALTVENNATIGGTLGVTGYVTMEDGLHVDGAVTMSDALSVDGDVDIDGSLVALGEEITLGTSSAVSLLTVNASSVFNGPVDINGILEVDGLILDDQLLTTVRTDVETIRDYDIAEDTELVTEKVVASWLPDDRGIAQDSRALVLNAAGEVSHDGSAGAGFTMHLGAGTLTANTITGATVTGTTVNVLGDFSVGGDATLDGTTTMSGNVNFSGTDNTVRFYSNPRYARVDMDPSEHVCEPNRHIYNLVDVSGSWVAGATVTLPEASAHTDKVIIVVNNSAVSLDLSDGTNTFSIAAGEAHQFVSLGGSVWYQL